jgi:uncharacterized protein YhhL (DUF1145 family)
VSEVSGTPDDAPEGRDWNALLLRVLEPFRSEAAAFRVLMGTVAVFVVLLVLVLLIRLIT